MTRCKNVYKKEEIFLPQLGIIVVEKINGKMKELATVGIAKTKDEVENLVAKGWEWIDFE